MNAFRALGVVFMQEQKVLSVRGIVICLDAINTLLPRLEPVKSV